MQAWILTCRDSDEVLLWRHSAGYFQVLEGNSYPPLLIHANYILIQEQFAPVFSQLTAQVKPAPVKIKDALLGTERNDYAELIIANRLPHTDNQTTFSEDIEIWTYGTYLFVSNRIKEELEQIDTNAFAFSKGFGRFG